MNNNLEKSSLEKNRIRKRNNHRILITKSVEKKIDIAEKRSIDGGFIAWPESEVSPKMETPEIEVIEGRSKKGGFIAFPKFKS